MNMMNNNSSKTHPPEPQPGSLDAYPAHGLITAEIALLEAWQGRENFHHDIVLIGGLAVHYHTKDKKETSTSTSTISPIQHLPMMNRSRLTSSLTRHTSKEITKPCPGLILRSCAVTYTSTITQKPPSRRECSCTAVPKSRYPDPCGIGSQWLSVA